MNRIPILRSFYRDARGDFLKRARKRRGSTLVVVISLMGLLSLLGLMFFTFATQEQENALNFSAAAQQVDNPALDADVYFNWALRQYIVGPEYAEKNSIVWGRRHALLPNAYGHDATPFNGQALVLSLDGANNVIVDMDGDGINDTVPMPGLAVADWPTLIDFVDSPVANFSPTAGFPFERVLTAYPEPDVDFTYPGLNNVFLAHIAYTVNPSTGARELVIKPSFHRPELLTGPDGGVNTDADGDGVLEVSDFNNNGMADSGVFRDQNWAINANWVGRSMRPHPLHVHVPQQFVSGQTYQRRYLSDTNPADAAIIASLPGGSGAFLFLVDTDGDGISNEQGVWTRSGSGPGQVFQYEYDVSNLDPQNGPPDSILMDLDFPVQIRASDNAKYIALFAPLIIDADSLFNLSIHGNLSGNTAPGAFTTATPGGNPLNWARISESAIGLTPSEVNLMWGLDAVPGSSDFVSGATPFDHLSTYFGFTGTPPDRWVVANMLHWWLNKGAIEYGTTSADDLVIAGRLGEASKVEQLRQDAAGGSIIAYNQGNNRWYFPYPGIFNRDDNRNFNEGGSQNYYVTAGTVNLGAPNIGRSQSDPFLHPLPLSGTGSFWTYGNNPSLRRAQPIGGNPSRWLQYNGFGIAGDVGWRTLFGGALMQGTQFGVQGHSAPGQDGQMFTQYDIMFDDMMEMILENDYLQRPHDEIFTWEDNVGIHLSSGDVANTGTQSRAVDLLAPLFDPQNCSRAVDIRRMYTTQSWDRKQFPLSRLFGPGPDGAPGIAGTDDNNNGIADDPGEYGWPGSDDARAWEFNYDSDGDGRAEFPPQFSGGSGIETAYYGYHADNTPDPPLFNAFGTISTDPFRPQLRRLLEVEWGNRTDLRLQFRLNVNELIDVVRAGNQQPGHPYYSPLEYRPLSPHTSDSSLTSVYTVEGFYDAATASASQLPPYPPTNIQQAEFWARFDRQRMARDIYVLLYTMCGGYDATSAGPGDDGTYPDHALASNGSNAVYSNTQLRRMAQFAVNLVDALDRDNVTTAFEYDIDLSDGWGLDDQPWVAAGPPTASAPVGDPDPADRAVVYGIEAQELTFSESLWVHQDQYGAMTTDNPKTMYDEAMAEQNFLYTELRSTAPGTTQLAYPNESTTAATAIWRVRRINGNTTTIPANPPLNPSPTAMPPDALEADSRANLTAPDNAVYFLSDSGSVQSVTPGGLFSISTGDDYSLGGSSDFYVDYDDDGDFDLVVPNLGGGISVGGPGGLMPNCDLDLVHTNHQNKFELDNGTTGGFLNSTNTGGVTTVTLLLERRMNPALPNLPLSVNPWIVMDTTVATRRNFNLSETDITPPQIQPRLAVLTSRQRPQPLDAVTGHLVTHPGDAPQIRFNSVKGSTGSGNNVGGGVVSPFTLVQAHFNRDIASMAELFSVPLRAPRYLTRSIHGSGATHGAQGASSTPATQLARAIGPHVAGPMFLQPNHPVSADFNNHWHRLLGLVEVPSRMHRQLGNPLNFTRVPGRINLNTLRYAEVLAGLIDDPQLHSAPERVGSIDYNGNSTVDFGVQDRNVSGPIRDYWYDLLETRDGVDPVSGLALPGTTASRPFRDPGILASTAIAGGSGQDSILRAHPGSSSTGGSATDRHLFDTGTNLASNNASTNYYLKNRLLSKIQGNVTTRSNVFFVFLTVRFHEVYEDTATGAVRIGGRFDLNDNGDGGADDEHRGFFVLDRSEAEKAYDPSTGSFNWQEIVKNRLTIN